MRWFLIVPALASCGVPEFSGFGDRGGKHDAGHDATSEHTGGSGGSGVDAGDSGGSSGDASSDAAGSCQNDLDCQEPTPRCDTSSGQCVKCLPSDDTCPAGQYCTAAEICQPGCKGASECNLDGGSGAMSCDPQAHVCRGCTQDGDCEPGYICDLQSTECTPGCTPQHACATNYSCCSGACFVLFVDVQHCGSCDNACPANPPNAKPSCVGGNCAIVCDFGRGDCNKDAGDGCEIDLTTDPQNCGFCNTPCAAAQTCSNGTCS